MHNDEMSDYEIYEDVDDDEEFLVSYDIATYPSDFTLNGIHELWETKQIVIPDFQREFVWTIKQSSLLIESFLIGLPVPPVFLYIDEKNVGLIIDGQQRIRTVVDYIDGYFGLENNLGKRQVFRLTGLSPKSPYYKKTFSDLAPSDQRKLKSAVLRAVNVRQLNPSGENTSVYHIFERLNTGGTALQPQEIRNCVFRGKMVPALREMNRDANWRKIIGHKQLHKHQKDVELVLRALALAESYSNYEKPMKEFLNMWMKKREKITENEVVDLVDNFKSTCQVIIEDLGERPFHLRGPLNSSAFDAIFCCILNVTEVPLDLKDRYKNLVNDEEFDRLTRGATTDRIALIRRMEIAENYLMG